MAPLDGFGLDLPTTSDALDLALFRARMEASTQATFRNLARRAVNDRLTLDPAQLEWLERVSAHTRPHQAESPIGERGWRTFTAWAREYSDCLIRRCAREAELEGKRPTVADVLAHRSYQPTGHDAEDRHRYAEYMRLLPTVELVAQRLAEAIDRVTPEAMERMTWPEYVAPAVAEAAERSGAKPPPSIRGEAEARAAAFAEALQREPAAEKAARLEAWRLADEAALDARRWHAEVKAARRFGLADAQEIADGWQAARERAKGLLEAAEALGQSPADDARMCKPAWHRAQIRREIRRTDATLSAILGLVGGPASDRNPVYVSRWTLARHIEHAKLTRQWAEGTVVVKRDPHGDPVLDDEGRPVVLSLGELIKSSLDARRARAYAFIMAMKAAAERLGYVTVMLTLTLPGEYHNNPSSRAAHWRNGERVARRAARDIIAPHEAREEIQRRWSNVRALLSLHAVNVFGIVVRESHEDMTPHMHGLLFVALDDVPRLAAFAASHFPEQEQTKADQARQDAAAALRLCLRSRQRRANARRLLAASKAPEKAARWTAEADAATDELRRLQRGLSELRQTIRHELARVAGRPWYKRIAANVRVFVPAAPEEDRLDDTPEQRAAKGLARDRIAAIRDRLAAYIDPQGKTSAKVETYLYEYATKHLDDGLSDEEAEADPKKARRRNEARAHAAWARQLGVRRFSFLGLRRGIVGDWTLVFRQQDRPADPLFAECWDAMQARQWERALDLLGAFGDQAPTWIETAERVNGYGETVAQPFALHRAEADADPEHGLLFRPVPWTIMSADDWTAEQETRELVEQIRAEEAVRYARRTSEQPQENQRVGGPVALTASYPSAPAFAGAAGAPPDDLDPARAFQHLIEDALDLLDPQEDPWTDTDDPLADLDCAAYW